MSRDDFMSAEWSDERDRPQARVLADSVSPTGVRLTTFEVTMHRFVLAEFNTHRVFSRNSESSRAVPFIKRLTKVANAPAVPVEWRAEQSGMQGGELLDDYTLAHVESVWANARDRAIDAAAALDGFGVHKSIVNRLLEPFLWHTVVVTATEWDGFFAQRCSPDRLYGEGGIGHAQPEIRVVADAMLDAYEASTPEEIHWNHWHTPLIREDEDDRFAALVAADAVRRGLMPEPDLALALVMISVARCARTSYLTHDGQRDYGRDLDLYERLVVRADPRDPRHLSPLEHVATPCEGCEDGLGVVGDTTLTHPGATYVTRRASSGRVSKVHVHVGNLRGWRQYRHSIEPSPYIEERA